MRDEVQARLEELRHEYDVGHKRLEELDRRRAELVETLLRISGALQVLDELLAERGEPAPLHLATSPPGG